MTLFLFHEMCYFLAVTFIFSWEFFWLSKWSCLYHPNCHQFRAHALVFQWGSYVCCPIFRFMCSIYVGHYLSCCPFTLTIVLNVLRYTASDYPSWHLQSIRNNHYCLKPISRFSYLLFCRIQMFVRGVFVLYQLLWVITFILFIFYWILNPKDNNRSLISIQFVIYLELWVADTIYNYILAMLLWSV